MSRTENEWREKLLPVHGGQWMLALEAIVKKIDNAAQTMRRRETNITHDELEELLYSAYGNDCEYCVMLGRKNPSIIRAYPPYINARERKIAMVVNPYRREPEQKYRPLSREAQICCQFEHCNDANDTVKVVCRTCNICKSNREWDVWVATCDAIRNLEKTNHSAAHRMRIDMYKKPGWKNWK